MLIENYRSFYTYYVPKYTYGVTNDVRNYQQQQKKNAQFFYCCVMNVQNSFLKQILEQIWGR